MRKSYEKVKKSYRKLQTKKIFLFVRNACESGTEGRSMEKMSISWNMRIVRTAGQQQRPKEPRIAVWNIQTFKGLRISPARPKEPRTAVWIIDAFSNPFTPGSRRYGLCAANETELLVWLRLAEASWQMMKSNAYRIPFAGPAGWQTQSWQTFGDETVEHHKGTRNHVQRPKVPPD